MTLRPTEVSARVRPADRDLGLIQITSVTAVSSSAGHLGHTVDIGAPPCAVTVMQRTRQSIIRRADRELLLGPGDVAVYPSTGPYTHTLLGGSAADIVAIPLRSLGLTVEKVDAVSAVNLLDKTPMAALVRNLFRDLVSQRLSPSTTVRMAGPLADILRLTLESAATTASSWPAEGLADRIVQFVLDNLGDPNLGAEEVARFHSISVRQMYAVLARSDIRLSALIQSQRLRRVRAALADPSSADVPIGMLAQQHGYVSASHFSRRFRQEFGMTPREWRHRHSLGDQISARG